MDARQFLAEFGHIVNAPEGVQQLREMIYNLAITGDLTSQLDEDGDASELLEKIKGEKDRRLKDKKFKRSPKLEKIELQIPENTIIPMNWVWTQLASIGEISPKNVIKDDAMTSFVPMSGISDLHSGGLKLESRLWGDIKKGFTQFADGDVVIAKITPCFENRKSAVITGLGNGVGAGTTELHVVRPIGGLVEPTYIYIFLRSPYFMIEGEKNMTGTAGQKRLPTEYFATRAFPLPPLEEQKRIVAKVDELMALCDKLEAQQQKRRKLQTLTRTTALDALANAQSPHELRDAWSRLQGNLPLLISNTDDVWQIKQTIIDLGMSGYFISDNEKSANTGESLLKKIEEKRLLWELMAEEQELKEAQTMRRKIKKQKVMYPDRYIPKNWSWGTFLEISQAVVDCHNKTAPYVSDGIHLVRTTDIRNAVMDLRNTKKITSNVYDYWARRMPPRPGDIFFTREAPMGEAAVVLEGEKVCLGQRTMLIRLFHDCFDKDFLIFAIYSPSFIDRMINAGVGATVKHLRVGSVEDLVVPVPPIEEQRLTVNKIKKLFSICDQLIEQRKIERRISKSFSQSAVASITGTESKEEKKMKVPKTELISKLKLKVSPNNKDQAPLSAILAKHNGELSSKALWNYSGLEIDAFYQQLKTEIARDWIVEPEKARMIEKDADNQNEAEAG